MSAMIVALNAIVRSRVIDTEDAAHVTGATRRSVRRWMSSTAIPRRHAEGRLLELMAVVDVLRLTLRDEPARRWLRTPNPELDWRKPLELIAEGEYRLVTASILGMAEGVTAKASVRSDLPIRWMGNSRLCWSGGRAAIAGPLRRTVSRTTDHKGTSWHPLVTRMSAARSIWRLRCSGRSEEGVAR